VRALFDVNVLLALFDANHMHHRAASNWRDRQRGDGWATCAITQNGFVRIMSRSARSPAVRLGAALSALQAQVASNEHEFWSDRISIADSAVFDHGRLLGPSQITDVYLLALAVERGGRLVTFERSIPMAAVRRAEPRHMVVL
jgi:toxin-antitoxin system PIN domain toxin